MRLIWMGSVAILVLCFLTVIFTWIEFSLQRPRTFFQNEKLQTYQDDEFNQIDYFEEYLSEINMNKDLRGQPTSSKKVAFAITITQDGPYVDGAAVLAQSIRRLTWDFEIELVAIVYIEAIKCRTPLEYLGFRIIEKDVPVKPSEIQGEFLRNNIGKNGCCGEKELLKLYAYTLTEYYRVVHLDMDSLLLQPIDELFYFNKSLIFTYDYGINTKGSKAPPVQGGFLIIQPDPKIFEEFCAIVRKGDYQLGSGWAGSGIGYYWGGQTIQGIMPYYYNIIAPPIKSLEVNRCVYNNMVDNPTCREISFDQIKNVHFTICQKPWNCLNYHQHQLCAKLHEQWFMIRSELEKSLQIPSVEPCPKPGNENYVPIQFGFTS